MQNHRDDLSLGGDVLVNGDVHAGRDVYVISNGFIHQQHAYSDNESFKEPINNFTKLINELIKQQKISIENAHLINSELNALTESLKTITDLRKIDELKKQSIKEKIVSLGKKVWDSSNDVINLSASMVTLAPIIGSLGTNVSSILKLIL